MLWLYSLRGFLRKKNAVKLLYKRNGAVIISYLPCISCTGRHTLDYASYILTIRKGKLTLSPYGVKS